MKRRSFIKILGVALLSPFVPSGSLSAETAIPDPGVLTIKKIDEVVKAAESAGHDHLHDSLQYAMMDYKYYAGVQWSESYIKQMSRYQYRVNKRRSLLLNTIGLRSNKVKL